MKAVGATRSKNPKAKLNRRLVNPGGDTPADAPLLRASRRHTARPCMASPSPAISHGADGRLGRPCESRGKPYRRTGRLKAVPERLRRRATQPSSELNRRVLFRRVPTATGCLRAPVVAVRRRSSSCAPSSRTRIRCRSRHPQDPPHRRGDAGEPLVRILLRHYPGADGIRGATVITVCSPDPTTRRRPPVPRHARPEHGRPARAPGRDVRHRRGRMDGFNREARRGLIIGCEEDPDAPLCSLGADKPDVMGYHDWHEIRTTGTTRGTSCSWTTCSSRDLVERAGSPVHGLRVVGPLPQAPDPMVA